MSVLTGLLRKLRRKKVEPPQSNDSGWRRATDERYRDYHRMLEDDMRRHLAMQIHDNYVTSNFEEIFIDDCTWLGSNSLPRCFICDRPIDNKEAISDAELLEKYTGRHSGILCCNCFKVAKTIIDGREVKQNAEA